MPSDPICQCWCHMDHEPEYDSHRDYFEVHNSTMDAEGIPNCDGCRGISTEVPEQEAQDASN